MLKINQTYAAERDAYGWTLVQQYEGICKQTGGVKMHTRKSYHPSLLSILDYIIDLEAGGCSDLDEVRRMIKTLPDYLSELEAA